jgi:HdeA/HdeB family
MRHLFFAAAAVTAGLVSGANAQTPTPTPLASYADKDGYINVQALTCAQLAGTYQEDANLLTTWYSGWYNGLAKKHFINIARSKEAEHEVIVFCKAHLDEKIIKAIDIVFKDMRKRNGIELSK